MARKPRPTPRRRRSRVDPKDPMRAAKRLAAAYSVACGDLPNIFSEGNPPGRVFHRWVMPMDATIALTGPSLATVLKVRAPRNVDLLEVSTEFDLDPADWGTDTALGYRLLAQMMRAALGTLYVAWIRGGPSASVRTYVFGRLDGSILVGLRVITVET
jgi:hypothetical protein